MFCLMECNYPKYIADLAAEAAQNDKVISLSTAEFECQFGPNDCPEFNGCMYLHVRLWFYAPSDFCRVCGMCHRYIHSNILWQGEYPHCNTVFITTDIDS